MGRARFLLQPRWILSHLFVLALVVLMVNLGFWQLRRLDERQARNELVAARLDEDPVPIDEVDDLGDARFLRVFVAGEWDGTDVRVLNRSFNGIAGEWVVSAVELEDGRRVLVSRGFATPDEQIQRATGEVIVSGLVTPEDRLDRTARTDLRDELVRAGTLPVLVQRTHSDPQEGDALDVVPSPALDEGPHLSYAVQWFIFSTIAAVGYVLTLRRIVRRRGLDLGDPDDDLDRELAELLDREGRAPGG